MIGEHKGLLFINIFSVKNTTDTCHWNLQVWFPESNVHACRFETSHTIAIVGRSL